MMASLPEPVQRLAGADFSALATAFSSAGFAVEQPAPGIISIGRADAARASVLLSVGVHGDETGPIEMLAWELDALSREPERLAVNLMVCVGNIDAIAAGKRFIDADLNRMFRAERGSLAEAAESARADQLIAATDRFFADAGPERWHLDLHTAIRPSRYPAFAIVPELIAAHGQAGLIGWLGQAGIEAVIMNPKSAGTFSYYSAEHHGAMGSTVELGRIGKLGENNLAQFADAAAALSGLLRGAKATGARRPALFKVAQEIIKLSDAFSMTVGRATYNFTPLTRGALIATDGATTYQVQHEEELVVFPNPDVRVGLRAGLMVVQVDG